MGTHFITLFQQGMASAEHTLGTEDAFVQLQAFYFLHFFWVDSELINSDEKCHLPMNTSHIIQLKILEQSDYSTDVNFFHDPTDFFYFQSLEYMFFVGHIHEYDVTEVGSLTLCFATYCV